MIEITSHNHDSPSCTSVLKLNTTLNKYQIANYVYKNVFWFLWQPNAVPSINLLPGEITLNTATADRLQSQVNNFILSHLMYSITNYISNTDKQMTFNFFCSFEDVNKFSKMVVIMNWIRICTWINWLSLDEECNKLCAGSWTGLFLCQLELNPNPKNLMPFYVGINFDLVKNKTQQNLLSPLIILYWTAVATTSGCQERSQTEGDHGQDRTVDIGRGQRHRALRGRVRTQWPTVHQERFVAEIPFSFSRLIWNITTSVNKITLAF
jgi:hypothetical protein